MKLLLDFKKISLILLMIIQGRFEALSSTVKTIKCYLMKKLLLLSAAALCMAGANAQSIKDYITVTHNGQVVADGEMVESDESNGAWFHCDFTLTLKNSSDIVKLNLYGNYTGTPTMEEVEADRVAWGNPQICMANGNCFNAKDEYMAAAILSNDPNISNDASEGGTLVTKISFPFEFAGEVVFMAPPAGPDFNPTDPSTWPTPIMPTKTSLYSFTLSGEVNGVKVPGEYTVKYAIGPNASGVEIIDVEYNDAPAVYFDLSGRKVVNPAKGQIVIEKKGLKATKKVVF